MVGSVVCYHPTCSWKSAGAFLQQCQVYPKQQLLVQSWGLMYAAIQLPVGSQLEPFFNSTKYILIEFSSIEPSISHVYPKKQLLVPWWGLFYITSKHPVGSQLEPFFNNTKYIPSTRCWYRAGVPFMLPSNLQQEVNWSLSSIGTKYIIVVSSVEPSISHVYSLQYYQVYPKLQLLQKNQVYPLKYLLVQCWGLFYATSHLPVGSQQEPFFNSTKYIPSTSC